MTSYDANLPSKRQDNPQAQELVRAIKLMASGYERTASPELVASYALMLNQFAHEVRMQTVWLTPKLHAYYIPPAPLAEHIARIITRHGYEAMHIYATTWAETHMGDKSKAGERRMPTLPEICAGVEAIAKRLKPTVPTALLAPPPPPATRDAHKAIWTRTNQLVGQGMDVAKAMLQAVQEVANQQMQQDAATEQQTAETAAQLKNKAKA